MTNIYMDRCTWYIGFSLSNIREDFECETTNIYYTHCGCQREIIDYTNLVLVVPCYSGSSLLADIRYQ